MIDFYEKHGFKLFPCALSKAPAVPKKTDWRDSINHLTVDQALQRMDSGHLVGAWLPKDFVVIDIDVNHVDGQGRPKVDGLKEFLDVAEESYLKNTLVVKTGSGGYHLYYKNADNITQGTLTKSVDVKTHSGYVIAAGSPGYSIFNISTIEDFPDLFKKLLEKPKHKATAIELKDPLSASLLKRVLNKLNHKKFPTNDLWLELMFACVAIAGNSDDVIDVLEDWSKEDVNYENDTTIRARIESLSPSGGITPATFIFILRREAISEHMIHKVRKEIGAFLNVPTNIKDDYIIPFKVPFDRVADFSTIAQAFFYSKDQANASRLFVELVKDNLIYSQGEKQFYFFHVNKWESINAILKLIYSVLIRAADEYYVQYAAKDGKDGDEAYGSIVNTLGTFSWRQKIYSEISQYDEICVQAPPWDSPLISETLTLKDGVVDFTKSAIIYREGRQEEYRKSFIDIAIEDFQEAGSPDKFKEFITDVFPDKDTRRLAIWALSLMISGTGKFRKFQVWNGIGRNGKSTLKEIIKDVIGEKAIAYDANILLQKPSAPDSNSVTPGAARFQGALVALASETEEGKKISQGMVKNMTGDETMTANPKYKDEVTFETTFQLVLTTNYLPSFSAHDGAFLDRLLVLPFYTRFYRSEEEKEQFTGKVYLKPSKDSKNVKKEVLAERAAILKLLVNKYIKRDPIPKSKESEQLLSNYVSENDLFGNFMTHYLELGDDYFVPTKDLTSLFNDEYNTRYSSTFIVRRIKEVCLDIRTGRGKKDGMWQRGLLGLRVKDQTITEGGF